MRRDPRFAAFTCFVLAAVISSKTTLGLPEPRVVIVAEQTDTPVILTLSAELETVGLTPVVIARHTEKSSIKDLNEVAREEDAIAAIRIAPAQDVIEVWLADRVTGKIVFREVVAADREDDALVSVRVMELLRASLLELQANHTAPGEVEAAPTVHEIAKSSLASTQPSPFDESTNTARHVSLLLGPGGDVGTLNAPPMVHFFIGIEIRLKRLLALGVFATAPLVPLRAEDEQGSADARGTFVGADLRLLLGDTHDRFVPMLGAGASVLFFHVVGSAAEGYENADDLVVSAVPYIALGISIAATDAVRVRADCLLGWSIPAPVLRFAKERILTFGRPLLTGFIGVELPFS